MRWFLLPSEALLWLQDPARAAYNLRSQPAMPFEPIKYPKKRTRAPKLAKVESHEEICALVNKMRLQRISSSELVKMTIQQKGLVECNTCGFMRTNSKDLTEPTPDARVTPQPVFSLSMSPTPDEEKEKEERHLARRTSTEAHQWHAPPKNIFKPALEVCHSVCLFVILSRWKSSVVVLNCGLQLWSSNFTIRLHFLDFSFPFQSCQVYSIMQFSCLSAGLSLSSPDISLQVTIT